MLPKGDDQARTMHSMLLLGLLPRLEGQGMPLELQRAGVEASPFPP